MEVGRIIGGKYRLQKEIGEGAMGSVWAGIHEVLGRPVAIKFLLPSAEDAETAAARFVAEAQAAARVKHRFTVDVFDFGLTEDGGYYMVQELLEGEPLSELMHEGPTWALVDVLQFTAQCLSGLEAVHQSGIVHRDLKPDNIFVIRDDEGTYPKLLDFGISRWAEATSTKGVRFSLRQGTSLRPRRLTGYGTTLGTPAYMSPEQLCNANTMNGRADLYSMGVVLFEWLTGTVPYGDSANTVELYRRISARSRPSIRALRPDVGPEVWALIDRALEPDPDQRFATAGDMRAQVLRILPSVPRVWSVVQKDADPAKLLGKTSSERDFATEPSLPAADSIQIAGLTVPRSWLWVLGGSVVGGLVLTAALMHAGVPDPARARGAITSEHMRDARVGAKARAALPSEPVPLRAVESSPLPEGREPPERLEVPPEIERLASGAPADAGTRPSAVSARALRRRARREAQRLAVEGAPAVDDAPKPASAEPEPDTRASAATQTSTKVIRTPDF